MTAARQLASPAEPGRAAMAADDDDKFLDDVFDRALAAVGHAPFASDQRCGLHGHVATRRMPTDMVSDENVILKRITVDPAIFGGKPIVRGKRLAVEHVLSMLAAGDSTETILAGYPWLEADDVRACLVYARRLVGHERIDPPLGDAAA